MFSYCYQISVVSLAALNEAACQLAAVLRLSDRLGLDGALGAGKTTFCQALGKALAVNEPMNSPTFTLLHYYDSKLGQIAHMDWYRLESERTVHSIMAEVEELLGNEQILLLVEWPCLAAPLFAPELTLHVALAYGETSEERTLILHSARLLNLPSWQPVVLEESMSPITLLQAPKT
jgi:tRNA threonylcarbamoyladenosine biosynthesis protein TsaE